MKEKTKYKISESYAEQGLCALCLNETDLRMSHIIPDAITKWIARTSLTGKLRDFNNPNKIIQGGLKIKMLCGECEHIFGEKEKYFQENIFTPIACNKEIDFEYTPDLLYYFISICWRWAVVSRTEKSTFDWRKESVVQCYIDKYRPLLLSGQLPKTEQGLLMTTGPITSAPREFKQLNSFYTRQAGVGLRLEDNVCIFHVRLPYFWFFHGPLGLTSKQISKSAIKSVNGYFTPSTMLTQDEILTRLIYSVMDKHNKTRGKLSTNQVDKITERTLRTVADEHIDDFHSKEILLMDWERDREEE